MLSYLNISTKQVCNRILPGKFCKYGDQLQQISTQQRTVSPALTVATKIVIAAILITVSQSVRERGR